VATLQVLHAMQEAPPEPTPAPKPAHQFKVHEQAWMHGKKLVKIVEWHDERSSCSVRYKTGKGWSNSIYKALKETLTPILEGETADAAEKT